MTHLVILPTYNEQLNIEAMLEKLRQMNEQHQLNVDVLVVDDHSPDGTGAFVADYLKTHAFVHLLQRSGKLGLGSAYRAGFQWAIEHGYQAITQMDCDFSHNPEDLQHHQRWLQEFDVVVGARYLPGGAVVNWNWWRRFTSQGGTFYCRLVLGIPLHDFTGGFNSYRTPALQQLGFDKLTTNGYAFQIEMKYRAWLRGLRFKEFPITFIDRRYGVSKIPRNEVPMALLRVLRMRMRRKQLSQAA